MADDINKGADGRDSVMTTLQPAWHGKGITLNHIATAEEAIEAANMDWSVIKRPAMFTFRKDDGELTTRKVPGKFVTVRADTMQPLGVVGARYTPLQNKDAFKFFDAITGEGEAMYHTAGVLGDGEIVWILAKLPEDIHVKGVDTIEQYLLLSNSHDGSNSVRARFSPVRVVCRNTLGWALGGLAKGAKKKEGEIRISHTANIDTRIKEAHEMLGIVKRLSLDIGEAYDAMASKQVNTCMVADFLNTVVPFNPEAKSKSRIINRRQKLLELFETGAGTDLSTADGTAFGLYNAVAEFNSHYRDFQGGGSGKMKSLLFNGTGEQSTNLAFNTAMAMI